MEDKYLIDTNIVLYYVNGEIPGSHKKKVTAIFKDSFNISTITKIELLNNLTLVTRNQKDFGKIKGLKIYNPFKKRKKNTSKPDKY